jgi:hypothetical protein
VNYTHYNIKLILSTSRISVAKLANVVGMQQPTLFRILKHKDRYPRQLTIQPLADLMKVSVNDFMLKDLKKQILLMGMYPWEGVIDRTKFVSKAPGGIASKRTIQWIEIPHEEMIGLLGDACSFEMYLLARSIEKKSKELNT